METLVVAHHRNHHQCRSRSRSHDPTRFDSFGSAPSRNFTGINCRSFQSGAGLLPTPMKSVSTSVTKKAFTASLSPKTTSPSLNETKKGRERIAKTSSVPIPIKFNIENEGIFSSFSERWAGPAYSNSPPPSSLPLPKFSLPPPKRTVSLHLPTLASEFDIRPMAKSAPASPTRGRSPSPNDMFDTPSPRNLFESPYASDMFDHTPSSDMFDRADATKTLRRILNLDITNEC